MAALLRRSGRKLHKLLPQTIQLTTRKCQWITLLDTELHGQQYEFVLLRSRFLSTSSAYCQQFSTRFNSTQKPENDFRRILKRLDDAVRATGRITQNQLTAVFSEVCNMKVATPNQALLLIRSCGSLLPEMALEKRSELAHEIWGKLAQLGTLYDVSHYNALLRVYLQNEHKFLPTDFLANMEAKGIEPNRVTYQRLIAAYCQMGDIQGATKILEFMKSKDLPVTEGVFNSLIEGHAKVGDMKSAKEILDVMRNVGLEPSFETYSNLLCAYATKGDMAAIESTLEELKAISISIPDKVYLNMIDKLACNGYGNEVPKILENVKFIGGFLQEAINLIISLLTKGHDESAFAIVRLFKGLTNETTAFPGQDINRCNFLIDHFVQMKMPLDKVCRYIDELQELGLHQSPYILALQCSLRRGIDYRDYSLSLLETMHKKNIPLRGLYFYPLMAFEANQKNNPGILKLFKMAVEMNSTMANEIFKMYVLPAIQGSTEEVIQQLKDSGAVLDDTLLTAVCRQETSKGNLASVYNIVENNPELEIGGFRSNINEGFIKNPDVESLMKLLKHNLSHFEEGETMNKSEYVGLILVNLISAVPQGDADRMRPHLELLLNYFADDGLVISGNKFRRIRTILDQLKLGGLKANAAKIVDPDDGIVTSTGRMDFLAKDIENIDLLEANLQELKVKQGNCRPVLRRLIEACCETKQTEKALEYKDEWDNSGYDPAAGILSRLIGVCSSNNHQQEALKLRKELKAKFPGFKMDMLKYCQLILGAVKEKKMDLALDLVDDIKECGTSTDNVERRVFFLLQNLTEEGYLEEAKQLTRKFIDSNIVNSNNNILRPVVTALMDKRDMEGALSWIQECQAKYGFMPSFHDILVRLINEGDKDMLQKAMEFSSSHHGDINMLYDMTFAFLTTGKFDEAKKIIDTPGMIARAGRLQWYSEKCVAEQMQEQMEKLVDITKDLYNCNRDNLYFSLLQLYTRKGDPDKCLHIWTNMQEEGVISSDRTLRYLANVLKSHNHTVPYEVPQIMEMTPRHDFIDVGGDDSSIVKFCSEENIDQALQLINDAKENKRSLKYRTLETVILSALKKGEVDTALKVRDIIEELGMTVNKVTNNAIFLHYIDTDNLAAAEAIFEDIIAKGIQPTVKMVRVLALKYEQTGNMDNLNKLIDRLNDSNDEHYQLSKHVLGALLYRNELDTAFTKIEEKMKEMENGDKVGLRSFFSKMIKKNLPLDKAYALANTSIEEGSDMVAWKLLSAFMDNNLIEDAKQLADKYPSLLEREDRVMAYTIQCVHNDENAVNKIEGLLDLTKNSNFHERSKIYFYLIRSLDEKEDWEGALNCREKMMNEGIEVNDFNLKRIALLMKRHGQQPPFTEPEKSLTHYREELKLKDKESPLEISAEQV